MTEHLPETGPNLDPQLSGLQVKLQIATQFAREKLGITSDRLHKIVTPKNLIIGGSIAAPAVVFALGAVEGAKTSEMAIAKETMDILLDIRGSIADGTLMVWFITGAFAVRSGGEKLRQRILEGIEALRRHGEQYFILGGEESGIMTALLQDNLTHVIPIVEKPEAVAQIKKEALRHGEHAFYLMADGQDYNNTPWERLIIRKNWLMKTEDGRQIMMIIGDGSVYEEALDLRDQPQQDLTIEELQLAKKNLVNRASQCHIKPDTFETVTVYFGNARLLNESPSGIPFTARQYADKYKTVDIWVDTRSPIIEETIEWLKSRIGADNLQEGRRALVFDTTNKEYFKNFSKMMKDYGVFVYDPFDQDIPQGLPVIVYEEQSAYTIQKADDMVNNHQVERENVATLTDTIFAYEDSLKRGIKSIYSAKIYRDVIYQIRDALISGVSAEKIQADLDNRWNSPGLSTPTYEVT